jgi:hypothetical protein
MTSRISPAIGGPGRASMLAVALVTGLALAGPAQAHVTVTAPTVADTYVREDKPSTTYGKATALRLDGSPRARAYARFDVKGTDGPVTKATLRVYAKSQTPNGMAAAKAANATWSETSTTWTSAPALGGVLSASGAIKASGWVSLDVTSAVQGDGPVSFALTTDGTTQVSIGAREGGSGAQLVVESAPAVDATPPSAPATLDAKAGDGVVTLDWPDSVETDLAGYHVFRRNADGTWPSAPTAITSASTWSDSGVANGRTYTYRVAAVDASGNVGAPSPIGSATPQAPSPADVQPALPIRAAFYYPWFPEAWNQLGIFPYTHYRPTAGFYDGSATSVIQDHVRAMTYGGIQAGIASWWGQNSRTDSRISTLLAATRTMGSPFRWALYYENESTGDPTAAQISSDLAYIGERYANDPAFLRVNGRPVIFVYADAADACGMADRWKQGNTINAYVVLKVFPGYSACASQPDGWHQYSPAVAADSQAGRSYAISPGFDKADEPVARLGRDLTRFRQNVRDMVASKAPWQLVATFNEWGEGTAVESADEWKSITGYGEYLDALHTNGDAGAPADTTAPAAPNTLTATAGDRSVVLDWADNAEADLAGYRVYRRNADGTWPSSPTASPSVSRATDDGLPNGTGYAYRVTAVDASGNEGAPSAVASATPQAAPAPAGDPVVFAAGDIACDPADGNYKGGAGTVSNCRMKATSDLIRAESPAAVLTLGDDQYESGTLAAYQASFDPTWGRMMSVLRPTPGNHEYLTTGASGYFDYFNGVGQSTGRAGERGKGYYSYDVGSWHLIALNSNCSPAGGCGVGSPQEKWLRADLAASPAKCTVAYWHHPVFSSGTHGNTASVLPLFQALYDAGADLVLSGHDHDYERFAPQSPAGAVDTARGIRQFVVGTGGKNNYAFAAVRPNSEVRNADTYGVLRLVLRPGGYDWSLVPEAGRTFTDSGSQDCH